MHYQPVDHVVDMEFGFWDENHIIWRNEGLPSGFDSHENLDERFGLEAHYLPSDAQMRHEKMELFFGLERRYRPPINVLLEPEFEVEEVEVKNGYRYYYDIDRVLCRVTTDGLTTMPEHLDYPLKTRKDWETLFKPRLDPDTPGRYPENLAEHMAFILSKDYMPWLYVGSLFGRLRNFVGFEQICYMIYDDPELVDEIIQHMADLTCEILERTLPSLMGKPVMGHFWEDICFNTGPMISPDYFREHVVPRYKQITDVLRENGIDTINVDCDGWIGPLVEGWLEAGVNIMFPLERAGGSDPVELRKKYGPQLLLMGGVDKKKMARGGDDIVRELEYLAPLVEEGGFIPHCDHLCPADVTLDKYRFYLRKKREIFGIPHREERIRVYPCDA
jgi:uroporphyrinogen decarboxylase